MEQAYCAFCNQPARLIKHDMRYRRGGKSFVLPVDMWQCQAGCMDPDGEDVYTWVDAAIEKVNDERVESFLRQVLP